MYLRCAVHQSPAKWKAWLSMAEFWYNSSYHSSLGCSPFKALYGHEPNFGAVPDLSTTTQSSVVEMLAEREAHSELLKQQLAMAQNRMKLQADRKRTERVFQVGEQVLLKLQPYAQSSVVNRPCPKLAFKYFGPYNILERIGAVAYRLELPEGSLIHPVFHVSQLKRFTPDFTLVYSELPKITKLEGEQLEPELVLQRRLVKKGNQAIPQVLVKWKGLSANSATWEDLYVVQKCFPDSLAWGQASAGGGEGVTHGSAMGT
uniref:Chromo domain-containing protein n=1 Tax=Arundo donax TaxID=35708 RepID=A0A0A8ZG93_ARUDO